MVSFSESVDLYDSLILIKLARFVTSREKRTIRRDIIKMIPKEVDIKSDPWATQKRLLLTFPKMKLEENASLLNKLSKVPGIVTLVIFKRQNFEIHTENLSSLVRFTLSAVSTKKPLNIKFQALGSIPFHKRAFLERIRKKTSVTSDVEDSSFQIYLECKSIDSQILSRLGFIYHDNEENSQSQSGPNTSISISKMSVVFFSPYTTIEIADFCRISLNFDFLDVIFSNENGKIRELLDETSKTSFKGMDKVQYEIIPSLNDFINQNRNKYSFIGFSLHATKTTQDLKQKLSDTDKIPCVIIGNEARGLEYSTQSMIDMFRIGTGGSEPLRASHVIAFVLGMVA